MPTIPALMLPLTVQHIDEDMRTPRGQEHAFNRDVDKDDFLDLCEDILEATHCANFKHAPAILLYDSAGLLMIEAEKGTLYWSRPEEENTERVETQPRELASIFFPKPEQG